ncbi:MAG: beta strand repeat-containing protein, partial [Planctomycetales bacterium]
GVFSAVAAITGSANGRNPVIALGPTGQAFVSFQVNGATTASILTSLDADGLGAGAFSAASSLMTVNLRTDLFLQNSTPVPLAPGLGLVDPGVGLAWDRSGGPNDGRLYMVYVDRPTTAALDANLNVFVRYSDNNGATWSAPQRVNDDFGNTNTQFLPRIAVDQAAGATRGNVAVTWYDARNDWGPGSSGNSDAVQNNDSQFWGAIGTYQNNRLTFTTNAKISQGTSRASLELTVGEGFGRYTGLDYNAGRMVPVWADNSTQLAGNPDGTARMDLATAVLGLTVPPVAQVPRAVSVNFGGTTSINENGGLAVGTTTLLDGSGNPLIAANSLLVTLTTNDATLASVPGSATILGGTSSRTFNVTGTNNALAQGPRTLIVTPNVTPLNRISSLLTINDDETPQLTVSANFNFDDEGTTLIGTVTRNTSAISPLTVLLSSTDTSELQVPASVVIPANQSSATFIITLLEDFQIDGTRQASIIASVEGMRSGSTTITVGDTQVEAIQSYNRLGDRNLPRHQGALQITSNTISHTLQTAILVSSGARDAGSANLPHPGSVTNGPTLNNARLVPGPQISNNVIYDFRMNGIVFSGDANPAGNPVGAAPYGRIVNNTLYGGDTAQGTGIAVSNNAAPTLLNNIVANTARALSIDATSSGNTVIGTTLFKGNTQTGPNIGTNPILLSAADPLFVNPTKGNENFYLKAGTALVPNQAIDSSLNTLQDRPSIVAVKSPLGIPESPITAPGSDRFGQLRIDDPNTPNATGLGQNIFKDRGAVERADFTGPASRMFTPLDNQLGVDGDPADDTVFIITPVPLTVIEVELTDVGIGIDNATVQSTDFILTRDGVVMVKDVDDTYSYNTNTHRAAFKSVSIFPSSSNYVVSVNTTGAAGFDATPIADRAGNALKPNQPNGSLLLKIVGNVAPTLTSISPLPGLKNITQTITYQQLKNASDLSVLTGHTADFRIESVVSGTLTISKNGAPSIAVVPGTTLIEPGDTLTWVQVAGATGITPAFKVIGYDPENAVVAPALSQSSPEVTVSVNLVNVAPTLTTIAPLSNGTEDTPYVVTYSTLVAASDLSDQNNDTPLSFQISQVTAGTTLQSSRDNGATYQPVVPGTTLVSNGDQLRWTPAANANSTINGGPLNAFTVVATDGAAVSLTAIQVKVDVAAVPDAPILTGFAGPFGLGGLNSQFKITYNDLVSTSDVKNVDGHAIQFRIESLPAGASMQIKSNGVLSTAGPGTIVSAGDSLFWTPPLNQFGQGNNAVSAFIVVAYDAFNHVNAPNFEASAPAVTAKVNVLSVAAPTLTTITTFTPPRYVPTNLTYTQIRSASDVTIPGSNVLAFRVESVQANIGTITITKSGTNNAVPLVAGQTLIESGDVVTWTSLTGASGLFTPFTVLALDKTTTLRSQEPVPVNVNLINYAPTLTSISTLSGGVQQTAYPISYATLKQNSNAQDANNDVLSFRIETISNGTLTITRNNVTSAVVPGTTQVVSGDTLTWTPANGVSGSPVGAFTVVAFDGSLASSPPVQVNVNVLGLGASYDLTGPWVIGGRLARISQNGANLTISDENGVGSSGSFTGYSSITGRNNLTGAVDTSAADQGRILWSDGKIWLRISLGGQYYNPANNGLTSVAQNGVQLTFTNVSGGTSTGTFLSASQLSVPGWNQTAT